MIRSSAAKGWPIGMAQSASGATKGWWATPLTSISSAARPMSNSPEATMSRTEREEATMSVTGASGCRSRKRRMARGTSEDPSAG